MGIVTGVIVFLLIWWTGLFAVLPFGHGREIDGTPVKPNMKKKLIINTVLAIVIWGIVYALIEADVISFRDMAMQMIEEDHKR